MRSRTSAALVACLLSIAAASAHEPAGGPRGDARELEVLRAIIGGRAHTLPVLTAAQADHLTLTVVNVGGRYVFRTFYITATVDEREEPVGLAVTYDAVGDGALATALYRRTGATYTKIADKVRFVIERDSDIPAHAAEIWALLNAIEGPPTPTASPSPKSAATPPGHGVPAPAATGSVPRSELLLLCIAAIVALGGVAAMLIWAVAAARAKRRVADIAARLIHQRHGTRPMKGAHQ